MFAHIFSWSLPQQNFTTESLVEKLFLSLSLSPLRISPLSDCLQILLSSEGDFKQESPKR